MLSAMNLNNVITILKNDLSSIREELLLAKEPDENAVDIDIFITNRSKHTARYLIKAPPVPLYFTHKKRGFAYYLSEKGLIKAIDLYDAPFISDATIDWFLSRSEKSIFNPEIKILSHEDQAAHLIYKALRKGKSKVARYNKIIKFAKYIKTEPLQEALLELCERQGESKDILQSAADVIQIIYSEDCSFERFSQITNIQNTNSSQISIAMRIHRKIKSWAVIVEQKYFFMRFKQTRMPMVCFVGVDGAGKSTTIEELSVSIEKVKFFKARMETKTHYHIFTKLYMGKIKNILEIIITLVSRVKVVWLIRIMDKFKLFITMFFICFDTKRKINSFLKKSRNGSVVIIDRWWSDMFIANKNATLFKNNPNILTKFLSLPRPDLVVLVEVPVELSIKRRADENLETLSYKKENLFIFIVKYFESNLLIIKGNDDMEYNTKQIHKRLYEVWRDSLIKEKINHR